MGFHSWVERKALWFLRFYDPFIFPEYLVIEIVHVLHRQIGIEVPCDWRKETSHFSGYRRGGIHDGHAAFAGKMNHERCGKGEMHPEMTEPFKSRLPAVFFPNRIVPNGAAIFDLKTLVNWLGQVREDQGIVRVAERIGVDEAKMGDIKEAFNLTARKAKDIQAWTGNLLKPGSFQ